MDGKRVFYDGMLTLALSLAMASCAPQPAPATQRNSSYDSQEMMIPMRDGTKLHTVVWVPKDAKGKSPIMMERTPYNASGDGPGGKEYIDAGYIFVFQDVRGRFKSEGKFVEIRPVLDKPSGKQFDETTDAYDTVDYLIKNVPNNNGKVGVRGVSYPGFYASCAAIRNHPAVKAVSPQAPVSEWFFGDDVHHNGAFFLQDNFDFYFFFGYDKEGPAAQHPQIEPYGPRSDAFKWFQEQGSSEDLEKKYYKGRIPFWNDIVENNSYNAFWKARSTPRHMKQVGCAVLTVGGWFDAEDLYGALDTYRHTETLNKDAKNYIIMGPWSHGGWFGQGNRMGGYDFGQPTGAHFRDAEFKFFESYLRGNGDIQRPEAEMFQTGANRWVIFDKWPPALPKVSYYLGAGNTLTTTAPTATDGKDQYISDPNNPIPYQPGTIRSRSATYMVADQRFLKDRTDILTYQTPVLKTAVEVAGPVEVDLRISTQIAEDCDLIVKVIDVQPDGEQRLLRWEVMPARFRKSFETPAQLEKGKIEKVAWNLPDVFHSFLPGHRIMVQVQSSWFPLIQLNPQKFMNPHKARRSDYLKSPIEVHRSKGQASSITFGSMNK